MAEGLVATGVSTDSRTLKSGDVYFAVSGARFDGHAFVRAAAARGAAACVVGADYAETVAVPILHVGDVVAALQALAGSLRAALANWRPVAIYGLLLFFCGALLPAMAIALIAFLLPQAAAPYAVALIVVPYLFLFIAAQTISDYVAYRDIFHSGEGAAPPTVGGSAES
jgi:hypothetical protein